MKLLRILLWVPPFTPVGVLLSIFASLKKNRQATLAVRDAILEEAS